MKNKLNKHKVLRKNIFFTVVPAIIFPVIDIIPIFNKASKVVFTMIAVFLIAWQVTKISLKEEEETQKLEEEVSNYKKYGVSQKLLNSIAETQKFKRNLLKRDVLLDYKTEVLIYNPHEYIEQVCSNIKLLIGNITEIPLDSKRKILLRYS